MFSTHAPNLLSAVSDESAEAVIKLNNNTVRKKLRRFSTTGMYVII